MHPSETSAGHEPGPARPAAMSSSRPLTSLKDVALRTRNQTLAQRRTINARSCSESSLVEKAPHRCPMAGRGLTRSPSPAKVCPLFPPIAPVDRAALSGCQAVITAHRATNGPDDFTRQVLHEQPRLSNMLIMAESWSTQICE